MLKAKFMDQYTFEGQCGYSADFTAAMLLITPLLGSTGGIKPTVGWEVFTCGIVYCTTKLPGFICQ